MDDYHYTEISVPFHLRLMVTPGIEPVLSVYGASTLTIGTADFVCVTYKPCRSYKNAV